MPQAGDTVRIHHFLFALLILACGLSARAEPQTVCTITVNSADEKEAFRRRLPKGQFRFVELVERAAPIGSPPRARRRSLATCSSFPATSTRATSSTPTGTTRTNTCGSTSWSAPRAAIRAGALLAAEGGLPIRLREPQPRRVEIFVVQGDSGLGRMRRIFANVPVIYGFSSSAPVGATAAMLLERYFDAGASAIGSGRRDTRLLATFARNGMTATRGAPEVPGRPQPDLPILRRAPHRRAKALVHSRDDARRHEGRERFFRAHRRISRLPHGMRTGSRRHSCSRSPRISADDTTRGRYLAGERATADPALKARMIALAATFGWLTPEERPRRGSA
jgi:hypothetical protein